MRYILFAFVPFVLAAQPAESGQPVTQTLIHEVQQLRLAIERSTLLGARTQLALGQFQLQESAVARISQQLNETRGQGVDYNGRRTQLADSIKTMEEKRGSPQFASPQQRDELEGHIKELKLQLEQTAAMEQLRAAREGELASELQAAQNQMTDARNRIAQMEQALDAAIGQLLKQK